MNITQPYWKLKNRRCPCYCGGEGFLVLMSCPNCGHVALFCDEVDTAFLVAHNSANDLPNSEIIMVEPDHKCPRCQVYSLSEFDNANPAEIQAAGFKVGEYD